MKSMQDESNLASLLNPWVLQNKCVNGNKSLEVTLPTPAPLQKVLVELPRQTRRNAKAKALQANVAQAKASQAKASKTLDPCLQ
jgi:hypothetical protein